MNVTAPSAATYCADLVRTSDFERYISALFAPAQHRGALYALYAFNIEVARVREQISQPMSGEIRLQWWSDALAGAAHGEVSASPVAAALIDAAGAYGLPVERLGALIEAHRFDLYDDPMPTMAELESYIADTAANLFDLSARIMGGVPGECAGVIRDAGLAYGLTAIIRAVPRHAARGQMFLPQDLLERFGVHDHDVFAGTFTPELADLIVYLTTLARQHLGNAIAALPTMPEQGRAALLPLALSGPSLDEIVRAGNNPFGVPVRSRLRQIWTLWRASRTFGRL